MILRKHAPTADGLLPAGNGAGEAGEEDVEPSPAAGLQPVSTSGGMPARTPLRWWLSLLTAGMVALAVGAMSLISYWTIASFSAAAVDRDLDETATALLERSVDPLFLTDMDREIEQFKAYNPGKRVSVSPPGWTFSVGDSIVTGGEHVSGSDGLTTAVTTIDGERVLSKRNSYGGVVTVAQEMDETQELVSSLGAVMAVIALLGVLLAITAGMLVAATGLRPISRLQRAIDYVTATDDLRPIPVEGNDELAQLTRSFNAMLQALEESRTRQTRLVADAGHELKTPLTSMRTNIELLFMASSSGHELSKQDRLEVKQDVLAQLTEMSTLINDLVDLARGDTGEEVMGDVELEDVIAVSLERVRRRRPDVHFSVETVPWVLTGDSDALGRAVINLLDNAAKWSPPEGTVSVTLRPVDDGVELSVVDSGPGIPEEDHERVFERFYRSPEARATPGSGLGLAIVKQVIDRHGGSIRVHTAPGGGTDMRVRLPGLRSEDHPDHVPTGNDPTADTGGQVMGRRSFLPQWRQGR